MFQLLSAIEHMHSKWYIHRDLKTANLLYNNKGYLSVCDFGLARKYGRYEWMNYTACIHVLMLFIRSIFLLPAQALRLFIYMYVCLNILNVFVYVIHAYSVHSYECITRVYSLLVDISFSFSFSPIAPYTAPVVTLWCKYIFCIYYNNSCT